MQPTEQPSKAMRVIAYLFAGFCYLGALLVILIVVGEIDYWLGRKKFAAAMVAAYRKEASLGKVIEPAPGPGGAYAFGVCGNCRPHTLVVVTTNGVRYRYGAQANPESSWSPKSWTFELISMPEHE